MRKDLIQSHEQQPWRRPAFEVRDVLADDWAEMLGVEVQQVNGRCVGELQPNA